MSDPYKILGVSPTATDEEVKAAYRALAKKYHPDNYINSPLGDLATEKMKEVNEAYDAILEERKRAKAGGSSYQTGTYGNSYGSSYTGGYGYRAQNTGRSNYADVRSMLSSGRIFDAEQILDGVPQTARDAEWFFLRGTVCYRKGWLDEASRNFTIACQMDPSNIEYRSAFNSMNAQRRGTYGGYNTQQRSSDCSGCDICSGLLLTDCCCECLGGDLISCC